MTIDLHIHSSFSADGEIAPGELVRMAARAGLRRIAITDHNRAHAVPAAVAEGERLGVAVVPGIELDCDFGPVHLHVLGYGIDAAAPELEKLWQCVDANERAAAGEVMDRVETMGIAVDREKVYALAGENVAAPERIAEAALADPRNDGHELLVPFRPGGSRSDNPYVNFYWDLCGRGKPAHVAVEYITLDECVGVITGAGGVPVLAHPGQSLKEAPDIVPELARHGIRGVEAFSSYHSPEACRHWKRVAEESNLFITCGSDFHGKTKPAIAMGGHGAGDDTEAIRAGFAAAMSYND